MGILDKILKPGRRQEGAAVTAVEEECPHRALVPHWDDLADMGKEDKVSYYVCEACHRRLTPEEAAQRHEE